MAKLPQLTVQIEPVGDNIFVLPQEAETVTSSGIVIPDTVKGDKPNQGVVFAVGKGGIVVDGEECSNPSKYLKVGDVVLYGKYSGNDLKLKTKDGKEVEVKILHLDSILGIVK